MLFRSHQRSEAWPVFQAHYNQWLRRALAGETLTIPERKAIGAPREKDAMSTNERKEALSALKQQLGF